MKTTRILILFLLAATSVCRAQTLAETITPEIQALARGLEGDPKRIFDYVHDHIRYQAYFGSKKGAELTLMERSGNDFDQCALLVALLRSANQTNLSYQFAPVYLPYSSSNHIDFQHWVGVTKPNTNWTETLNFAGYVMVVKGGFPFIYTNPGATNDIALQHVWVQLNMGGTNYVLDPAFKVSEATSGIDVGTAMGLTNNDLVTAAGGSNTTDYVQNVNEAAMRDKLKTYTTNLLGYLQANYANASVEEVLSGQQIVSSAGQPLGAGWPFRTPVNTLPTLTWSNIPTNLMTTLMVTLEATNQLLYMPQLAGHKLSMTFDSNGLGQLWLEGTVSIEWIYKFA